MIHFVDQQQVGKRLALCALLLLAGSCAPATSPSVFAAQNQEEEPEPVAVTVFTEKAELFMEYPRLVPGLEARFLAHVTVLASGAPVKSGELRLELSDGPEGSRVLHAAQPARDGLFIPVGSFRTPGQYQARIVINSEWLQDTIPLDPIVVHADLASAQAAAEAEEHAQPADLVPFLLEQQWKIGLLMRQVERRTLTRRLRVPGEIEAPQHAMAVVSAPLAGRLLAPKAGSLPHLGDRVEAGQVLALLEPPLSTSDSAQLAANQASREALAMELALRAFDLETKALEAEQTRQESEGQLGFARQALERIERLREKDLGTEAELQAARRDVELAQLARQGSLVQKANLGKAQEHLDQLMRRNSMAPVVSAQTRAQQHELLAPISGEIVAVEHVAGEHIESQGVAYRILDLSRIWITAHVSEFDLAGIGSEPNALLSFAAYPDRRFDVLGEMQGRMLNLGPVVDPETRTIALRYDAANPEGLFRAGMFADVFLETQQAKDAIAIPESAIVIDNGRPVAFVLLHGEAFQKRVLELGLRDGAFVEVLSGIQAGDRVVTKGAYLVKLAAASPASFGAGHAH